MFERSVTKLAKPLVSNLSGNLFPVYLFKPRHLLQLTPPSRLPSSLVKNEMGCTQGERLTPAGAADSCPWLETLSNTLSARFSFWANLEREFVIRHLELVSVGYQYCESSNYLFSNNFDCRHSQSKMADGGSHSQNASGISVNFYPKTY